MEVGSWQQTLDDANQVFHSRLSAANLVDAYLQLINLDPSSPCGYEMKYTALHETGDYDNAIRTFQDMLSRIEQLPHPDINRKLHPRNHDRHASFTSSDRAS